MVLTDAADLVWGETQSESKRWLTRAWAMTDQLSESAHDDSLKEFFTHSDRSKLRTVVLGVARKYDADLAETFLKQLTDKEAEQKKTRGAFDDRTARSEQLLGLAQQAVDSDPGLAFTLAEKSLTDGISQGLQNVLTSLRKKNVDLANRLFDLALTRFSGVDSDSSEAEVLAGYLFQSGFTFSANSSGQTMLVVNPALQNLPAVAPAEPQRARNLLVAVYHALLARPISLESPEGLQRAQRVLILGRRLTGLYDKFAPEFAQPARAFLAQLQTQISPGGDDRATDRGTATTDQSSATRLTKEEVYEKYLTRLEDKADKETNPIAKKLAYVEAALAATPEDYRRAERIAGKIDDAELLADTVSFVFYRAALAFAGKDELEKACELAPQITKASRRAVVKLMLAQCLLAKSEKAELQQSILWRQLAFDFLSDVDRDFKNEEASANVAKILLGRAGILAKLDRDQALASLGRIVQLINKLDKFDLRDRTAPNLGLGTFAASGATVASPSLGFDFRSAIEPLIATDFEQVSAITDNFAAKEVRGAGRLAVAKVYLNSGSSPGIALGRVR
jgi:hypothetical protein